MAHQTILICDNEAVLRRLVCDSLSEGDYELIEAEDGVQALELARAHRPELILLDMMMPGKTGLEVLDELRADPDFADTRIVMLTARAQTTDRDAADTGGADLFLPKPFSPLELARRVDELLAER